MTDFGLGPAPGRPSVRRDELQGIAEATEATFALPNNLPEQLTSFVGREQELSDISKALSATRLLTLTGAGGCGKTRLAAQTAAAVLDRFPDGAWWVELAPLADPDAVGPALGEAIGVKPLPGQSSLDAALAHLADLRALLVLDNCEHLLDVCANATEVLLHGCRALTVLASSRAPLGVSGETDWRVPSLSLPSAHQTESVAIAQSDAVRLFIERAVKVRPNFAVDAANAPAIAQICHDLDGIPLAIELAAARVRVLGVERIASGLGDRFRLLTGGARSAMPRQQTLRASVDWSHELLSDDERVLFRRMAVFAGGWTLDAVEEVCACDPLERLAILDLLSSLVEKSLVIVEEQGSSVRYRLLETVRQYALDRLVQAGEVTALRDRHRDVYLALAERIAPHLESASQSAWLDLLDVEAANLAAALEHASDTDGECALRLCVSLTVWWKLRGRFALADDAYVRALGAVPPEPSAIKARVLWARGYLLTYGGRFEEAVAGELQALEMARSLQETSTAARALDVLGTIQMYPDPAGVREGLEQSRELARASGDEWCFVDATQILGFALSMQADQRAVGVFEEALEIIERTGYAEFAAWHWVGVGGVRHLIQGRDEEAFALYERAIAVADAVGEPVSAGYAHAYRSILRAERGDGEAALADLGPVMERSLASAAGLAISPLQLAIAYTQASAGLLEQARASLQEGLEQEAAGGPFEMASSLSLLARTELALGLLDSAAEHAQAIAEIADGPLDNPTFRATASLVLACVALARGESSEAEGLAHKALGAAIEHGLPPYVFPSLDVLAAVAGALDSFEEAGRILGAAERAREELGRVRWAPEQALVEELQERLRAELGESAVAEAIAQGAAMSTEQAIGWLRRARGSRKRPAGGWESLTPTELQVVRLAAEGLTNPEIGEKMFIARGTVKMHLSHIYAKLDVRNRSELASLVTRREPR
jgi:predicted ATPase/DNA-binding CsgD family transcriptional regulator